MIPLNYALAAVLLTSPADPDACHLVTTRPAVRDLCLAWEILDPRETRYVLTRAEDFGCDLKLMRRRYVDLLDAPPLYDCMRFPDRAAVNELLQFNRAFRQHIDDRLRLEPSNGWELIVTAQETEELYKVWDLVRDTRCDYYYVTVRRQALKLLRERIGDEAYYSGQLPPVVPLWRFQRIP